MEDVIRPGFARYREMIADEILPAARSAERPGFTHLEGGDDAYRRLAAVFTSLPTPPEEIHRIGTEAATEHLPDEYAEVGSAPSTRPTSTPSCAGSATTRRSGSPPRPR